MGACCGGLLVILALFWPLALSKNVGTGGAWAIEVAWLALVIGAYAYWRKNQCPSTYTTPFGDVQCGKWKNHKGSHSGSRETGRKGWRNQKSVHGTYTWE